MEIVALFLCVLFVVLAAYAYYSGFKLGSRLSWLFFILGFIIGIGVGLMMANDFSETIKVAFAFAIMLLISGISGDWHKRLYKNVPRTLLSRYENDQSTFAKLLRKLFRWK